MNKSLQKSIEKGIQEYDEVFTRNIQLNAGLVNSHIVDTSIVKTISNLPNDKNKSHFRLEPVEGSSNLFTVNTNTNPQQVRIKGKTLTFLARAPRTIFMILIFHF